MPKKTFPTKVGDGRFEVQNKLGEASAVLQSCKDCKFAVAPHASASACHDSLNPMAVKMVMPYMRTAHVTCVYRLHRLKKRVAVGSSQPPEHF